MSELDCGVQQPGDASSPQNPVLSSFFPRAEQVRLKRETPSNRQRASENKYEYMQCVSLRLAGFPLDISWYCRRVGENLPLGLPQQSRFPTPEADKKPDASCRVLGTILRISERAVHFQDLLGAHTYVIMNTFVMPVGLRTNAPAVLWTLMNLVFMKSVRRNLYAQVFQVRILVEKSAFLVHCVVSRRKLTIWDPRMLRQHQIAKTDARSLYGTKSEKRALKSVKHRYGFPSAIPYSFPSVKWIPNYPSDASKKVIGVYSCSMENQDRLRKDDVDIWALIQIFGSQYRDSAVDDDGILWQGTNNANQGTYTSRTLKD
ncbi:hypothetical protein Tco_0163135 [Tanacetum coccineum]